MSTKLKQPTDDSSAASANFFTKTEDTLVCVVGNKGRGVRKRMYKKRRVLWVTTGSTPSKSQRVVLIRSPSDAVHVAWTRSVNQPEKKTQRRPGTRRNASSGKISSVDVKGVGARNETGTPLVFCRFLVDGSGRTNRWRPFTRFRVFFFFLINHSEVQETFS